MTKNNLNKIAPSAIIAEHTVLGTNVVVWHFANLYNCTIGNNVSIGAYTEIGNGVMVGDNCRIQARAFIPAGVTIGKDVFIGPGVIFTNIKYPSSKSELPTNHTLVENHASIGAGAIILPGVRIGERALIGAGSLVTKDVLPYTVVYGNPAKIKKKIAEI